MFRGLLLVWHSLFSAYIRLTLASSFYHGLAAVAVFRSRGTSKNKRNKIRCRFAL